MADGDDIANRLRAVRGDLGYSQADMAERFDIALSTLKKIELGKNVPSGETLLKYAKLGYDPGWILTGNGSMRSEDRTNATILPAAQSQELDHTLFQAIFDTIIRVHKELSISLPLKGTVAEAVTRYNELCTKADDRDERLALVGWLEIRLRKDLSAAKAEPGTGKRSA